jgi:hypothetical protein
MTTGRGIAESAEGRASRERLHPSQTLVLAGALSDWLGVSDFMSEDCRSAGTGEVATGGSAAAGSVSPRRTPYGSSDMMAHGPWESATARCCAKRVSAWEPRSRRSLLEFGSSGESDAPSLMQRRPAAQPGNGLPRPQFAALCRKHWAVVHWALRRRVRSPTSSKPPASSARA